ncbi:MAG TPA: hypothetical protein VMH89_09000 [Candidatus Acidoferrum sp.]|nr:hypothetical protein [Candidatus Acidoferrum sp.]
MDHGVDAADQAGEIISGAHGFRTKLSPRAGHDESDAESAFNTGCRRGKARGV